jgi:hypothetical protein
MKLSEYKTSIKKKSKYRSERSGGYDSKKEHRRGVVLELMEKQGYITNLKKQVRYVLAPSQYITVGGKQVFVRMELAYVADFVYNELGREVVEDVKGYRTAEYKRKKRLMKLIYGIVIKET